MKRHIRIETTDGRTTDIYCHDVDENDPHEIWFTTTGQSPLRFSRASIKTWQEIKPLDSKTIEALNAMGEKRRKMERSKNLNYNV
jgi:hypothetical protein